MDKRKKSVTPARSPKPSRRMFNMQAFQIWYLASYLEKVGAETDPVRRSRSAFPDMSKSGREKRLAHGAEFMESLRPRYEAKLSNSRFNRPPMEAADQ